MQIPKIKSKYKIKIAMKMLKWKMIKKKIKKQ